MRAAEGPVAAWVVLRRELNDSDRTDSVILSPQLPDPHNKAAFVTTISVRTAGSISEGLQLSRKPEIISEASNFLGTAGTSERLQLSRNPEIISEGWNCPGSWNCFGRARLQPGH